ncbi:hypothetical protein PR001_g23656 [Phytophthora rubi]|uniref:Uncharacterized protein n=1 Tax=Phytophthora rubi TaxID=129364 RepID=A0A6A3IQ53_9STRA|nr:hypothetical protein PR001_g23656 [Phytophthora rubi]
MGTLAEPNEVVLRLAMCEHRSIDERAIPTASSGTVTVTTGTTSKAVAALDEILQLARTTAIPVVRATLVRTQLHTAAVAHATCQEAEARYPAIAVAGNEAAA